MRPTGKQVASPEPRGGGGELCARPTAGKVQERGRKLSIARKAPVLPFAVFRMHALLPLTTYHLPIIPALCTESPGTALPVLVVPNPNELLCIEHEHAKPRQHDRESRDVPCTSVLHCFSLGCGREIVCPHAPCEATLSEPRVGSWLRLRVSLCVGQDRLF